MYHHTTFHDHVKAGVYELLYQMYGTCVEKRHTGDIKFNFAMN